MRRVMCFCVLSFGLALCLLVAPTAVHAAPTTQPQLTLLGAVASPRPASSYRQLVELFEPIINMSAARDNQNFMRDVISRLFPSVQRIKLHRLLKLLPSLAAPLGISLNKSTGLMVYAYQGRFVPVLVLSIQAKTFMNTLRLLDLNPQWQQQGSMRYLVIGHKVPYSVVGWLHGIQLHMTLRNIPPGMGLQNDTQIRQFFQAVAELRNPLDAAFQMGGSSNLWRQALQDKYDVVLSLPSFKPLAMIPQLQPLNRFVRRLQVGLSLSQKGHQHTITVEAGPGLKPFLKVLQPTTTRENVYAYAPASTVWLGQAHINIKALLHLLKNLPQYVDFTPRQRYLWQHRWSQLQQRLQRFDARLSLLSQYFTGHLVSGLMWSSEHNTTVRQLGPIHGVFWMFGLHKSGGTAEVIQKLQQIAQKVQQVAHPPGNFLQVKKLPGQGVEAYQLTFMDQFTVTIFSRGTLMIVMADTVSAKQIRAVLASKAPSLAQVREKSPAMQRAFQPDRAQTFALRPNKLRALFLPLLQQQRASNSRKRRQEATTILMLLTRLTHAATFTTVSGDTISMGMDVGLKPTNPPLPPAPQKVVPAYRLRPPLSPPALIASAYTAIFNSYPVLTLAGFLAQMHARRVHIQRMRRHYHPPKKPATKKPATRPSRP